MADPRALLNTYAEGWHGDNYGDASREDAAPYAFAALRAVLALCATPDGENYDTRYLRADVVEQAITDALGEK